VNFVQTWSTPHKAALYRHLLEPFGNPSLYQKPYKKQALGSDLRTWHHRCTLHGTSKPLEEQQMKLLLATMFKKVPVRNTQQRATLCKRCGARIYTLSFLKAHLEAHDRKSH
jgi:hypothetical protein